MVHGYLRSAEHGEGDEEQEERSAPFGLRLFLGCATNRGPKCEVRATYCCVLRLKAGVSCASTIAQIFFREVKLFAAISRLIEQMGAGKREGVT